MDKIVGIDKLTLWTKEFILPSLPKMIPSTSKELGQQDDVLVRTMDGECIYGSKLHKNTRDLKICSDVKIRRAMGSYIDRHSPDPMLTITLNPNKNYHDYKPYSDCAKLKLTLKNVGKELKDIGIITDPLKMHCARIDLNQDQELTRNYEDYKPIFDSLGASRKKVTPYATGVSIGNKSSELVFYGKAPEVFARTKQKIDYKGTRCESRFLKGAKIKDYAFYLSRMDLILDNYDFKDEVHYKMVEESLKGLNKIHPSHQLELFDHSYHRSILETMVGAKTRATIYQFIAMIGGIDFILDKYETIDGFVCKVINPMDVHRQKKKRLKDDLLELYSKSTFLKNNTASRIKEIESMTDELLTKFLKAS